MEEKAKSVYEGKMIAGPMVRGSILPFRLACLQYGADVAYTAGLTDIQLANSTRIDDNGHVRLTSESNGHQNLAFHTCTEEKGRLVLQIVSTDGATATKAVQKIQDVVAGVDLNCGCPESFACHRGGGSAITMEAAVDVIKSIRRNTDLPVSAKIRVSDDIAQSVQFAQAMESAGALALTIHGRTVDQKHKGPVDHEKMKTVFDSVHIIKIGNGGVKNLTDAQTMRADTGCSSVMISGAALFNPSIFSSDPVTPAVVVAEMAKIAKKNNEEYHMCKWLLTQPILNCRSLNKQVGPDILSSNSWEDFDRALLPAL